MIVDLLNSMGHTFIFLGLGVNLKSCLFLSESSLEWCITWFRTAKLAFQKKIWKFWFSLQKFATFRKFRQNNIKYVKICFFISIFREYHKSLEQAEMGLDTMESDSDIHITAIVKSQQRLLLITRKHLHQYRNNSY